ncbi:MAG: hypothetical protein GY953_17870 [bacterium]|nr:hypothetical protein [bacterium]
MISPLLIAGVAWGGELEPISSAEVCGSCHRAIHEAWKSSAHATAMESRVFQDALELAESDFGAVARKVCLGCHAPLAARTGDLSLKTKVSWEGVTCDYCHSMRSVTMGARNPAPTLKFSLVKSGPLKAAGAVGHETVFSEVHTSSLVCAPCHEYRNPLGLDVLTTYSEWKNSRYYREDVQCQSCHMGRVAGDVVDPRVKRSGDAEVNLHEMPGGHSLKQLHKAIRMRLLTKRNGGRLEVTVMVINAGAGHHVPTGSPLRELTLEVNADAYQGQDFHEKRTYRRTVAGRDGKTLTREHVAFFRAAKVVSDTRLAPDEKRRETFSFAIPEGVSAQVTAKLMYSYSPVATAESREQVTFRNISRLVR